jgi:hypothetical protein
MMGEGRKIAVYGTSIANIPVKQRYWKLRRDGIRQRYWKKTTKTKRVEQKGRFEFTGKGRDLLKAVRKAVHLAPKGYVTVSAKQFLEHPERYGWEGEWIDREIESARIESE